MKNSPTLVSFIPLILSLQLLRGGTFTVTSSADSAPGSLRAALGSAEDGDDIVFASNVNGSVVRLTTGELVIGGKEITIDASALSRGLTLNAGGNSRVLRVIAGKPVELIGLTLTGGSLPAEGTFPENAGGAILNDHGNLRITRCTLSGNFGGAYGGAISNHRGVLTLINCTFAENSSALRGGAIHNFGPEPDSAFASIQNCTLSGNSSAEGGGVFNQGNLLLENSIIGENSAPVSPDLHQLSGNLSASGRNLFTDPAGAGAISPNNFIIAPSMLAPLGYFGGSVETFHPLAGSPAIDAVGTSDREGSTDARGFSGSTGGAVDIGAVEVQQTLTVTHPADAGEGSLRAMIAEGALLPGSRVVFAGNLEKIILSSKQLTIPAVTNGLFIDASDIPGGIIVDANASASASRRVMEVERDATANLHSLTFTGGRTANRTASASDPVSNGDPGGGVLNRGKLTLGNCMVVGNATGHGRGDGGYGGNGGGISNFGSLATLKITGSTLKGNFTGNGTGNAGRSGAGGAISNVAGTVFVVSSTLTANSTGRDGNGILNGRGGAVDVSNGVLHVSSSTISNNSAGLGGGIFALGPVKLRNCIVAANHAVLGGPDILELMEDYVSSTGVNLIGDAADSGFIQGVDGVIVDPNVQLAPLGDYGGPTATMPPLLGSPVINGAAGSSFPFKDQRGFPRIFDGTADLGAVEFQGESGEFALTFNLDSDGDGTKNGLENALGTNPLIPDAGSGRNLRLTVLPLPNGATVQFGVNEASRATTILRLTRSQDLLSFGTILRSNEDEPFVLSGDSTTAIVDPSPPPGGRAFYRLEATLVDSP